MYKPMLRYQLEQLASELGSQAEIVTEHDSYFLKYRGLTLSVAEPAQYSKKPHTMWHIKVYQPEINRYANDYNARQAWETITHSINVAMTKTMPQIAKDMLSRLDFDKMIEIKVLYDQAEQKYQQCKIEHKRLVDRLCLLSGRQAVTSESGISSNINLHTNEEYYGNVRIDYQSVSMEINSIENMKVVESIMAMLWLEQPILTMGE